MADTQTETTSDMTWGRIFRVWWLFAWRGLSGFIVIGGAVGYIVGLALGGIGTSKEAITAVSSIIGVSVYLLWGLVIVRMALNKKYRDFDLKLTIR